MRPSNSSGTPVTRYEYFAFGEGGSLLAHDPRQFLGQELDNETGFSQFGARYYRNVWGRFTTVDPVFSDNAPVEPQLWNRYAYALNNPMRYIDPTGLSPEEPDYGSKGTNLPDLVGDRLDPDAIGDQLNFAQLLQPQPVAVVQLIPAAVRLFIIRFTLAAGAAGPAGSALGRALERAGQFKPFFGWAAHHIVAKGSNVANAQTARNILAKWGIPIESAVNGVWLPGNRLTFNGFGSAVHSTLHTSAYYAEVASRLLVAKNPDQARAILNGIAAELQRGGLIMSGRVAR